MQLVKQRLVTCAALFAVGSVTVGIVYAAIPSGNVISACYGNSGNASLRVIDAAVTACKSNETRLDWNVQGPKGDIGLEGPIGPMGLAGPQGVQGPKGDTGAPGISRVTFAFNPSFSLPSGDGGNGVLTQVASKTLPEGSWAIVATANLQPGPGNFGGDRILTSQCELRSGASFIGGATDRRVLPEDDRVDASLSMNGGAQIPAGGGQVSLWCLAQLGAFGNAQIMIMQVGGFF